MLNQEAKSGLRETISFFSICHMSCDILGKNCNLEKKKSEREAIRLVCEITSFVVVPIHCLL